MKLTQIIEGTIVIVDELVDNQIAGVVIQLQVQKHRISQMKQGSRKVFE